MHKRQDVTVLSATDLANHLSCQHLTHLNRRAADGELERPIRRDAMLETLIERGLEHEKAFVEHLRREGRSIVQIEGPDVVKANEGTLRAMQAGADVIVQGALMNERWSGRPDLLLRVDAPSKFGAWSYEVADTKLSQNTRGGTILQLCLYSELVSHDQGIEPREMAVVKPGNPFNIDDLRVDDFMAYYRSVKLNLEQSIDSVKTSTTYPDPVAHCDICNWWSTCNRQRRDDDHLSFVAGIQKHQIAEFVRQEVTTLERLATSDQPLAEPPKHGSVEAFERVHRQAQLQHKSRTAGTLEYEFLDLEERRGFLRLPAPDAGDIFFDIEGDPHVPDGGLEYLLGYVVLGESKKPEYKILWGLDRRTEKESFERFIDSVTERCTDYPGMHIYHYAHYEPSAMKRLAMRYATREDEVDRLLRAERFVDLYAVVRQGIQASVESYSIKKLEPFYGYKRLADLEDARLSLRRFERALELRRSAEIEEKDKAVVQAYNKDDCLSTLALRNWLEALRTELEALGKEVPRPELLDGAASETVQQRSDDVAQVFERLVAGIPDEARNQHESARWLLAHLLDYFRREDKCIWWEFFRMHDLEPDELIIEKTGLSGLSFVGQVPGGPRDRNPTHRYRFPVQEAHFSVGNTLIQVKGETVGTAAGFNLREGILDIKKRGAAVDVHPSEVFTFERIRPAPLPESILEFAKSVAQDPRMTPRNARYDLLSKQTPRLKTLHLPLTLEPKEAAIQLAFDLEDSVLPIQGPPGAGKTFIGSHMIAALAKADNRVGVTAISHKVITNLLQEVLKRNDGTVRVAQKISSAPEDHPAAISLVSSNEDALTALQEGCVVGGTAWLWANQALEEQLDYLFVDEAGQMSLAVTLAAGRAARNIVLLGDPQQLEQPQLGSHPEGAEVAALNHLLDGGDTLADDRGLFIPDTWRLHPSICKFTSAQYYDGRLSSRPGLERQVVTGHSSFPESGLAFVPVSHHENKNRSPEEAEAIRLIFEHFLDDPRTWYGADRGDAPLTIDDLLVVAPYNAQVALLQNTLPDGARVGTVDKFQGQQGAIVIYSLTSSSVDDAPRGMSFLYSPNRMNVATSRARCLAIVVASPTLFYPECATPEQIRLANGLCRFVEMATVVASPAH